MKTYFTELLVRCVAATVLSGGAFQVQAAGESPTVVAILQKASSSSQLVPALEEVVKLTKARVPDSITLAYIQSSPTAFAMDAQDILRLNEQGVSPQVVTAMLQHGEEVRRAAKETSNQAQTVASAQNNQSPAPAVTTPAPTVVEPSSSVSVTYIGYPRYSYYPSYASYGPGLGYYYPAYYSYAPRYYGYCGPRVSLGIGFGYRGGYYGGYGRCR